MDANFYPPKYKDGKVLAFADVDVADGVIVRGFRVVRGDRGVFAAVPSRSFSAEGQTRYYNQVAFSSTEIRDRFLGTLLEAYQQWDKSVNGGENREVEVTSSTG